MILQDNFFKIKSKMHNVVKGFISLSKPEKRFLLDMLLGVFTTNSFNLMSISRNLSYEISIKHIYKRLHMKEAKYKKKVKFKYYSLAEGIKKY